MTHQKLKLPLGVIHKGCPHKFRNFWNPPPPPVQAFWLTTTPNPSLVRADTRLALFEALQLVNNSYLRVKKLIILFENNVKNIRMKTISEMMSLRCVPYILYWIQAEWKFYIQTYCQIIWVNFTNMVAIIFFPSGRPHLANHPPPPPVRIYPLLSDPTLPPLGPAILYGWSPVGNTVNWFRLKINWMVSISNNIALHCMKFNIDFFSKCDQIRNFLWIWSHFLTESVMKNFIFV